MEIWLMMKENPKYEISNKGRVRNKKTQRILKTTISKKGYERFIIYEEKSKPKMYYIHRVVANNYIDNKKNYKQVNHINENKRDNNVSNLEWCNNKYNNNYKDKAKRSSIGQSKYKIIQKDKNNNIIKIWPNIWELRHNTTYETTNIRKCCKGQYDYAYGYKWEYEQIKPIL